MKRKRPLLEIQEEKARSLYVCFPHTIKDAKEVEKLFDGDFTVKLPRQSSRYCHVIFSSILEKTKNLKAADRFTENGKHIIVRQSSVPVERTEAKKPRKKVVIPKAQKDIKVTQSLYISNIKGGTKTQDLKEVLPGCVSVTLLKAYKHNLRGAIVKMESLQIASEYLLKKREWPVVRGNKLMFHADTRTKRKKNTKTGPLKIYDGDHEISDSP